MRCSGLTVESTASGVCAKSVVRFHLVTSSIRERKLLTNGHSTTKGAKSLFFCFKEKLSLHSEGGDRNTRPD